MPDLPALSEESILLIREAASDDNGTIMKITTFGGLSVQTNGKQFVDQGNPRSEATWEAAVQDLLDLDLLRDNGNNGEIFSVTNEGYAFADRAES